MRFFCNFSLASLGIRPRSRRCAGRPRQGERRWSHPPKPALEQSYLTKYSNSANRILNRRRKTTPDRIPETKYLLYMYLYSLSLTVLPCDVFPRAPVILHVAQTIRQVVFFSGRHVVRSVIPDLTGVNKIGLEPLFKTA